MSTDTSTADVTLSSSTATVTPAFDASEWATKHVSVCLGDRKGWACHLSASAVLPLSAGGAYELLTHPENSTIFRGIDSCTFRKILSDDGCGRMRLEVENVAVWRFLFFSGRIATRLHVAQDYHAGTMHLQLAPDQQGPRTPGCKQVPIQMLEARWSIKPLSECLEQASAVMAPIPPEAMDRIDEGYCFVSLEQSLQPWGIPGFLHGAFKGFAKGQVVQTFEDVLAEAARIRAGFPSLCPYEEVCMKEIEILPEQQAAEATGTAREGAPGSESPMQPEGGELDENSTKSGARISTVQRKSSLKGHRLEEGDWWEMDLDEVESAASGAESAEGSCTPMDEVAGSDAGSDVAVQNAAAAAALRCR